MPIDTKRVILDFHRSASGYESEAKIQLQVMSQLLELFQPYVGKYAKVLDVGCGTGWLLQQLQQRKLSWHLLGVDVAEAMCREAHAKGVKVVRGDAENLPFADASVDAVFSSLCVQWLDRPQHFMREAIRVLRPGGRMAIATLGDKTLTELREAFSAFGEEARVMAFRDPLEWTQMGIKEGFFVRHIHDVAWKHPYNSMMHLCRSLRGIGAVNKRDDRTRGLTGAALFERAQAHYDRAYARPSGEIAGKRFGGGVWSTWQPLFFIFEKPA